MIRRLAAVTLALLVVGCFGDATRPSVGVPTLDEQGNDGWIAVSAGREHSCALAADGAAWCWGSNEFLQLGVNDDGTSCVRGDRAIPCRRVPTPVNTTLRFKRISAGGVHTCALADDDVIYCWGDNLRGELGDPKVRSSAAPVAIVSTARFFEVAAGGQHSCGLRTDGVGFCWGANDIGQIGNGSQAFGFGAPSQLNTALRFVSIVAGDDRTCARIADGSAYCWGSTWVNRVGGADVTRSQNTPLRVQTTLVFSQLSLGNGTTCGIAADNSAHCWEANGSGAMGDGTAAGSLVPQPVRGGHRFVAIASGAAQTCALADTGNAWCWGAGSRGELGVSSALLPSRCERGVPCTTVPLRVSGWRVFTAISGGQGSHNCGLTLGGNVYCWGAGDMGQRGDGRVSRSEWAPAKTRSPQNVSASVTGATAFQSLTR